MYCENDEEKGGGGQKFHKFPVLGGLKLSER
jgi:hypothetical protein